MTMMPEAKLAREAEICYASIACVTDFDSWKQRGSHEIVTVDLILGLMRRNIDLARDIIRRAVPQVARVRKCECARSLREALVTSWELIPPERHRQLDLFLKKYLA
jgi:5'-methylthioadenosine phosphorylase